MQKPFIIGKAGKTFNREIDESSFTMEIAPLVRGYIQTGSLEEYICMRKTKMRQMYAVPE